MENLSSFFELWPERETKINDYKFHYDMHLFSRWVDLQQQKDGEKGSSTRLVDILGSPAIFEHYTIISCVILSTEDKKAGEDGDRYNPQLEDLLEYFGSGFDIKEVDSTGDYWLSEEGIQEITLQNLYSFIEAGCVYGVIIQLAVQELDTERAP